MKQFIVTQRADAAARYLIGFALGLSLLGLPLLLAACDVRPGAGPTLSHEHVEDAHPDAVKRPRPPENLSEDKEQEMAIPEMPTDDEHAIPARVTQGLLRVGEPVHRYPLLQEVPVVDHFEQPGFSVEHRDDETLLLRIPLSQGEAIWGFGQRFDAFDMRGRRIESWATDGWNRLDTSYFAVPFFISSRGYGLFVNGTGRLEFDIGASHPDELSILIPGSGVELIAFQGAPAQISQAYTELVGRPRSAPAWIYRPWMSRNSYLGAYEVNRMLRRMHALDMPVGVVVLEAWAEQLHNFQFELRRYPNPITWIDDLKRRGVHVVCWITPSVWPGSDAYREAREHGYLVLDEDGSEHIVRWLENGRKIDFRNPEARDWWRDMQRTLVEMGVSGIKTDGGEHMPDPVFHNQHPYHYQKASLDAFRETDRNGITFARSANPLNAGLSTFWAGDQLAEWSRLEGVVRAGLSTALSGFPLWGHDIGGYSGTPTKELYLRWMQFGAFSPIMQFHGETPREPWNYDEETVDIVRFYFKVRKRLLPFLIEWGETALTDGIPIMRPLVWHFPDDPRTYALDSQFMLGPDLIIAPIVSVLPMRTLYLPEGEWLDLWTDQLHSGPIELSYEAELHQIPVFVRADAVERYQSLFADAPHKAPSPVTVELSGPKNEWGIVPELRYWLDRNGPEQIQYRIQNHSDEEMAFAVRLAPPAGIEVHPRGMIRFTLGSGESSELTYNVQPVAHLSPGTYPLTFEVRSPGKEDIPAPSVGLVLSPSWMVLGLFEGGVASEQDMDIASMDLNASYAGRNGERITWQDVPIDAMEEDGLIDLGPIVGGDGFSTSYLYTRLFSPYPRRVHMLTGCGDAMTIWVNDRETFNLPAHRNPARDEDVVSAVLTGGMNHIVIRISRDLGAHHFFFRME